MWLDMLDCGCDSTMNVVHVRVIQNMYSIVVFFCKFLIHSITHVLSIIKCLCFDICALVYPWIY